VATGATDCRYGPCALYRGFVPPSFDSFALSIKVYGWSIRSAKPQWRACVPKRIVVYYGSKPTTCNVGGHRSQGGKMSERVCVSIALPFTGARRCRSTSQTALACILTPAQHAEPRASVFRVITPTLLASQKEASYSGGFETISIVPPGVLLK
jgi:hypothetical protein